MPWWVYICKKQGRLYTGITTDVSDRMCQHRGDLLYEERYEIRDEAVARERQIKKWRRGKKISLTEGRRPR
jgi:putative endonuclease